MKKILWFLPDALAVLGAGCIVAALWLAYPVAGLLGLGGALLGGALLLAWYGGGGR